MRLKNIVASSMSMPCAPHSSDDVVDVVHGICQCIGKVLLVGVFRKCHRKYAASYPDHSQKYLCVPPRAPSRLKESFRSLVNIAYKAHDQMLFWCAEAKLFCAHEHCLFVVGKLRCAEYTFDHPVPVAQS